MISLEEASDIVIGSAFSTGTEKIPFSEASGRILAGDVFCDRDLPPFNRASVDGFACRWGEPGKELEIVATIAAGMRSDIDLEPGQCVRIMTGAAVPEGADCVVMVEDTVITASGKMKFTGSPSKDNISRRGEDLRKGDLVLRRGHLIRPQDIAVMAVVGYTVAEVARRPLVGIISTGDELVEPEHSPDDFHIRNSNGIQLMAQVGRAGCCGRYYGIARDDPGETLAMINKTIAENDVVILTGGVSMGDFDFIPRVLEDAGVRILFDRVAVQPGKPTTFGVHDKALVFGLPGNPVSSFVQFELLVRPLLSEMCGYRWKDLNIRLPMKCDFRRKSDDRINWIPVMIDDEGLVEPVAYHGSAHITAFPYADGIIPVPVGIKQLNRGEMVRVRLI